MTLIDKFGTFGNSIVNLVKTRASVNMDNLTPTGEANLTLLANGIPKSSVSNVVLGTSNASYTAVDNNTITISGTFTGLVPNGKELSGVLKSTQMTKTFTDTAATVTNLGALTDGYLFVGNVAGTDTVILAPYKVAFIEPDTKSAGDMWYDLSMNQLKQRNSGNTEWVVFNGFKVGNFKRISGSTPRIDFDGALQMLDAGTLLSALNNDSTPVGTVIAYMGTDVPPGYLLMDGRSLSRTTYSKLFSVIGTTQGAGDGSTTFNIADMTDGRYLMGSTVAGSSLPALATKIMGGDWTIGSGIVYNAYGMCFDLQNDSYYFAVFTNGNAIRGTTKGIDSSIVSDIFKSDADMLRPASVETSYLIKY